MVGDPLAGIRVLPVIVLDEARDALALAQVLAAGGLTALEITLRTPAAVPAICALAGHPGVTVGAGTVVSGEQVDVVAEAGVSFVVSPGFSAEVAERCARRALEYIPGVATATEVLTAVAAGARRVKFFPAGSTGGLRTLDAFAAVFSDMRFVPTGGIGLDDVGAYLHHPAVDAVGGSWMAPRDLIRRQRFDDIAELVAATMEASKVAR